MTAALTFSTPCSAGGLAGSAASTTGPTVLGAGNRAGWTSITESGRIVSCTAFMKAVLPWRWWWLTKVYHIGLIRLGGDTAYDSCGKDVGERCRHNMEQPDWMRFSS